MIELHLCIVLFLEVKSIRNFILDLAVMVETNRELSVRLIEHDERCLSTPLALLHISNTKMCEIFGSLVVLI